MVEVHEQNCSLSSNGVFKHTTFAKQLSSENGIEFASKQIGIVKINESARSSCSNTSDPTNRTYSIQTENTTISDSETINSNSKMHIFGWGKLQPKFLQRFCTVKWALFWLCWGGALQGFIVNGFVNVVITTLERRFGLRSTQTGLVASGYDIASFLCLLPISYFGGRKGTSKPKYLAWGVVVMGIGSLVFALPHFLVGAYSATLDDEDTCKWNDINFELQTNTSKPEETIPNKTTGDLSWAIWFFLSGQLLLGAGAAPLYTLGVAYIDENVSRKMSSVYLGIYYTMAIIGPAAGYVVGGQLLLIYTDFLTVESSEIGLSHDSSVWIGAWWIGFIIGAILCFLLAIPMFGYPKTLSHTEKLQHEKNTEAVNTSSDIQLKSYTTLKELPHALWALLYNPTLVFLNMAAASEAIVTAGFATFLPKLIENQYSISPIFAAMLLGVVTVPAGGGGTFLGGYLVKKFKLNCTGIIKMCTFLTMIAAGLSTAFLLSCPNLPFAGVTVNYHNTSINIETNLSLEASCNSNCTCNKLNYDPICGVDNIMYFNPCYAGCQEMMTMDNQKTYANCSCIFMNDENLYQIIPNNTEATNSKCESACSHLPYFIALLFMLMLSAFSATMPLLSATLRCVRDDQRSFALGIQWLKVRMFGTIPAPILFGTLIDRSCILWHDTFGGDKTGSCLMFSNHGMSTYIFTLAVVGKSCSFLFFIGAWRFYKPSTPLERNSIQETDNNMDNKLDNNMDNK